MKFPSRGQEFPQARTGSLAVKGARRTICPSASLIPTKQRVSDERSVRSSSGELCIYRYIGGTPSNTVAR